MRLGYTDEERRAVPEGADMGLGCGNPQAIAELKPGERVSTSGAVRDSTLSSQRGRWAKQAVWSALT